MKPKRLFTWAASVAKHDRKYESSSIQETLRLAGSRKTRLYRFYNHDEFINHILAGHVVDQPGKEEYGT